MLAQIFTVVNFEAVSFQVFNRHAHVVQLAAREDILDQRQMLGALAAESFFGALVAMFDPLEPESFSSSPPACQYGAHPYFVRNKSL